MPLRKMILYSKKAKSLLTPSLFPTPSLTSLDQTTTRHTPHPGMVREIEAEEMLTGEIGLVEMKEIGIEVEGLEVEGIEAEVKETKLATVTQTQ